MVVLASISSATGFPFKVNFNFSFAIGIGTIASAAKVFTKIDGVKKSAATEADFLKKPLLAPSN
jgi:hypothetical protein